MYGYGLFETIPIRDGKQLLWNEHMERLVYSANILEIGYAGYNVNRTVVPIVENAIGLDLNYPNYDGIHLPFENESMDSVYSSHVLEHIVDYKTVLQEWFRVTKTNGYLIIIVPHQLLYEKKKELPSQFAGGGHVRFYLPHILLSQLNESLQFGSYRLRYMCDNDLNFDYNLPHNVHSTGCYEIECVIEKIPVYDYINKI